MNKYNIKVGDYVETWDGGIGYVIDIGLHNFSWIVVKPRPVILSADVGEKIASGFIDVEKLYKRIGENDFTKKEDKFKPIENIDVLCITNNGLAHKIEELIDHVNAIQERLNNYGSEKERY